MRIPRFRPQLPASPASKNTMRGITASAMDALAALQQLHKSMASVAILSASLATAYLAHGFYSWYRLSHVPGPFWAAFSKYWMVRESLKGRQPIAIKEVTDKYGTADFLPTNRPGFLLISVVLGSLARIGPNELVTDDPDVLRRMMGVRSAYTRGPCTCD